LIDTHCHLDQIDSPEAVAKEAESRAFTIIAVTNLPSHYARALEPLRSCTHVKPALGFHPLMAAANQHELMPFTRLARTADHIGEIGLDFSEKGIATKEIQTASFARILDVLRGRRRFITIHSRGAVGQVLDLLEQKQVGPAVFHWFTGSGTQLARVIAAGHSLSINPAMLRTASGMRLIESVPRDRVLTETDAPFSRVDGRPARPWDVKLVLERLGQLWTQELTEVDALIGSNYARLLSPNG